MSIQREVEYELHWRRGIIRRAYEDILLRRAVMAQWPWWRKAIWKVFGR